MLSSPAEKVRITACSSRGSFKHAHSPCETIQCAFGWKSAPLGFHQSHIGIRPITTTLLTYLIVCKGKVIIDCHWLLSFYLGRTSDKPASINLIKSCFLIRRMWKASKNMRNIHINNNTLILFIPAISYKCTNSHVLRKWILLTLTIQLWHTYCIVHEKMMSCESDIAACFSKETAWITIIIASKHTYVCMYVKEQQMKSKQGVLSKTVVQRSIC